MATWFNDNINIVTLVLAIVFFIASLITWATIDTSVDKGSGYVVPIMLVVAAAVSFIAFIATIIKGKTCPSTETATAVADQRRPLLATDRPLPSIPQQQQQQWQPQQQWQQQ